MGSMVELKSSDLPSEENPPRTWGLSEAVMRRAAPPTNPAGVMETGITYRFRAPSRVDSKAIWVPSGENAERRSSAGWTVRREQVPESRGAAQRSPAQAKTTVEPSGDRDGYSGKPTLQEESIAAVALDGGGWSATVMGAGAQAAAHPPATAKDEIARNATPRRRIDIAMRNPRTREGQRAGSRPKWAGRGEHTDSRDFGCGDFAALSRDVQGT